MYYCPNCGSAMGTHLRECNQCGAQLMIDYFAKPKLEEEPEAPIPRPGASAMLAMVFGIFGCAAVLIALGFHLAALFGYGVAPSTDLAWWIYTFVFIGIPSVYLAAVLTLKGSRLSILFDYFWLFTSTVGIGICVQWYLIPDGPSLFYGIEAAAYLIATGCILVLLASVISIIGYRKQTRRTHTSK